jgi:hypothetical protein
MPSGDKRITCALYGDAFNVKQVGCQKGKKKRMKRQKTTTTKKENSNEND